MLSLAATGLLALGALDALRRVYAVGREANDHAVALGVLGCVGFFGVQLHLGPAWLVPAHLLGGLGVWAFFHGVHRRGPASRALRWGLGVPSQLAIAYALWAGLLLLLRLPLAFARGEPLLWAGAWNLLPLTLALAGLLDALGRAHQLTRHRVPGLPVRVVQLSDLHVCAWLHADDLRALLARVRALDPDLIVITGDLLTPFSEADHAWLPGVLAEAGAPVLACAGNHDLPALEGLREAMEAAGVPLLVDAARVLELRGHPIEVVGLAFHWAKARERMEAALAGLPRPEVAFSIALLHDPRGGPHLPPGRFELALSGHLHGGHVAANAWGFAASALRLLGARDQGTWPQPGGLHHVHRGSWTLGLPPRMGVSSEIALFEGEEPLRAR